MPDDTNAPQTGTPQPNIESAPSSAAPPAASPQHDPKTYLGGHYDTFAQHGELSEAAIQDLVQRHKKSPEQVRFELDGLAARRARELRDLYEEVGGQEVASTVFDWARNADPAVLSPQRRSELQQMLRDPNPAYRRVAMQQLKTLYDQHGGGSLETRMNHGTARRGAPAAGLSKYDSGAQEMSNRRAVRRQGYGEDPRVTKEVKDQLYARLRRDGAL